MHILTFQLFSLAAASLICGVGGVLAQAAPDPASRVEKPDARMAKDVPEGHPPIVIEQAPAVEILTAEKVQKMLKKLSATEYELNGMKIDLKAGELRVPAQVKMTKGPLEYVLSSESGSVHEALFVTKNNPFEIQVAMLLMGFKASETFFTRATPDAFPQAATSPKIDPICLFDLHVDYLEKSGTHKDVPVESWVKNLRSSTQLKAGSWVFNGSFITEEGTLAAMDSGNVISLYLDPLAIANNPRQDNELDDNWEPMADLPAEDTPVTIIFRRPKASIPTKPAQPAEKSK